MTNQWASGPNMGRGGPNWGPEAPTAGQQPVSSGSYAAKLQLSSHSRPSPGAIVPKMQSLNISGQTSQSSAGEGILPIKRPDNGGLVSIKTVNILVNHFPVSFNPETVIGHYDIDVKPEVASAKGRPVRISKANLSLIMDKLFSDDPSFPLEMTAYDGEKNIFSAVSLPTGQFKVKLSGEEEMRCSSYIITVNLVNELRLHKLKDYLAGNLLQIPRDVLQGMDVVMKENPRRRMVSIGRSFHPKDPIVEFKNGLAASQGFQQGLKPTSQGLALCLDYSVLAVRKRIPVLDFLREHICGFSFDCFHRMRREIESALKGLKVTVTHRVTKQKYVVSGLTDKRASDISFTLEDPDGQGPSRSVRLVDYFAEKYGLNIQYRDVPCLNLGRGGRVNYVPIELCVLVEGQRYPKENLDYNTAAILKNMSLAQPQERKSKICGILQDQDGPCGGGICNNFEMDVRMNMTKVQGRVIRPPILKLRSLAGKECEYNPQNDKCEWNLTRNSVVEGKSLERWAVIDFSQSLNDKYFIPALVERCKKLGLKMDWPLHVEWNRMQTLSNVDSLAQLMERINYQACGGRGNLQLILCVMARKDDGYKYIKWISETKMGIVTQCCISKNANKANDQYLANLGMKINAKLGGSNVELNNRLPLFEDDSPVMLIGADVNHPRPMDRSSPSIAAVVASMNWPAANKYSPRVRFQQHGSERIINFGEICLELIEAYEKFNGVKPGKILIFRDGVSEGQFEMVLNEELLDLKKVLEERKYRPTITLIVARKRHHTRLFPETPRDGIGRAGIGNVPPGTVVDRTIVHPFEFDFYLCSHHGSIGTSKPTHYHVLWDEHGFSSDKLQELIYNLCFTFARCCKPVSLVPPVYYADLLAYRGRLYFDALTEKHFLGSSSSSMGTSSSSTSGGASIDESICKLHSDLENMMFFV